MSFKPSAACCTVPPVVSKGYNKKGTYETVGGLKTYVTGPPSAKNAILVVYDIFGFSDQMLQGADILAISDSNNPYRVFVPDFFEGKPADISWYPPTTEEHGNALRKFFRGTGSPGRTVSRIPGIVKAVKESHKSIESVFALGMCWGGKVVTICSGADSPFKAVAQAHPAMIDPEDAKKVTVPTCLLPSQDEDPKDVAAFVANLTVPNYVKTFSDQIHGWMAARADLENPNVAEQYRKGYQSVLNFFAQQSGGASVSESTNSLVMWSCPSAELAEKLIEFMLSVPAKAKKDGQSYVVSARAGTTYAPFANRPSRAQGFNVISILEFKSVEDIMYWGSTDPVHKELLALLGAPMHKDPIVLVFTSNNKNLLQGQEVVFVWEVADIAFIMITMDKYQLKHVVKPILAI